MRRGAVDFAAGHVHTPMSVHQPMPIAINLRPVYTLTRGNRRVDGGITSGTRRGKVDRCGGARAGSVAVAGRAVEMAAGLLLGYFLAGTDEAILVTIALILPARSG